MKVKLRFNNLLDKWTPSRARKFLKLGTDGDLEFYLTIDGIEMNGFPHTQEDIDKLIYIKKVLTIS